MIRGSIVQQYTVRVTGLNWLTPHTFELRMTRPAGFDYQPGQKITFREGTLERDYTLLGPRDGSELAVCVRHIPEGRFTPRLARAGHGDAFRITGPQGFFTYQPSNRTAVFVATGTGVAPFVAFARDGVQGFHLLHGVRCVQDLYYRELFEAAADRYVPCLSAAASEGVAPHAFSGRVVRCVRERYTGGEHDFYLCGRDDMIRDVMAVIDDHCDGARVFTEAFF